MLEKTMARSTLAAFPALILAAAMFASSAVHAQADGSVSAKVGKPLQAGMDAASKGQFPEALARLKEADAISGKTTFEQLQIDEAYCSVYARQRNYNAALAACEKTLGKLSGGQANERLKTLAQIAFQTKPRNLRKTIEYADRYLKATGGNDASMYFLAGQAQYLGGNYKGAVTAMRSAARIGERAGKPPEENLLRYLLDSYSKLKNQEGVAQTTTQLVRLYPSPENWRRLTTGVRRDAAGDDQIAMHVYRLMYELDVMNQADVFSEAAIVAIQAGLPSEAVRFMERGYASKAFEGVSDMAKARNERILKQAREQAAALAPKIGPADEKASTLPDGNGDVRVGEAYLDAGKLAEAVRVIQRGLGKGGIKNADEAYMLLGEAHVRLGNSAEARKAFDQVEGEQLTQIARLWSIHAAQI